MHCVLLVPDGVGVRNFLLTRSFKKVMQEGRLSVLHIIPSDILEREYRHLDPKGRVNWFELVAYWEPPSAYFLRYTLLYAQMYWADTQAMRYNRQRPISGSWRRRIARGTARFLGRVMGSPRKIRLIDYLHCKIVGSLKETEHYRRLFKEIRPSVLFCSHQRPPIVLPPVLAAKDLGIPTATFIFSWDNLTSKGRIAAPFDYYFVWSNHMKRELLTYYPDISPHRVFVVGTPQFDPYADETLIWSREEFFQRIGADSKRPLICYSGGDTGTCPEDPEHARILMELVHAGKIRQHPQVLVRPAPVDDRKRYALVLKDFPEIIFAPPAWIHARPGDWASVLPTSEDIQFLANLTYHADLNINVASTMTLDFAIRDKPVVNIAFDVAKPPPHGVPLWDYFYRFEHYRPVVELRAARFARSPEELAKHINAYLEDPSLDHEARRKLVELEVGVPIGQAGERIVEVLKQIGG